MIKHFLFFLVFTNVLYAHQTGLSYVEMSEQTSKKISVVYKKPLGDIKAEDITLNFPSRCTKISKIDRNIVNGFIIQKYTLECESSLVGHRIWIEGLVRSDRGVVAIYKNKDFQQQAVLKASSPFMLVDKYYSKESLFFEYVDLGVVHILKGYDHLMFVFLLVLLAPTRKILFIAVSAFTLSHSLTLAFAILGIVKISIAYVEAMIALSIIFLAREMIVENKESLTRKYLGIVAFIFGLLHGFGFSSVLSSIGLPQDEIPLALFSFNVGIELGQLLFVGVTYILLMILKRYLFAYEERVLRVFVYAIGAFSAFWFLQRSLCPCV